MIYILSKILGFIFQPTHLAVLALAAGFWRMRRTGARHGQRLAAAGLGWLLVAGLLPLGNALILPLEQVYATAGPPGPGVEIRGILILGGAEQGRTSAQRGSLALNEAGERFVEGARLARRFPAAQVALIGGPGRLWPGEGAAAPMLEQALADLGVAPGRLVVEQRSRTTYENALAARNLLKPQPQETWILVTSAYHMPRAVAVFRHVGFSVLPCPVDYRTSGWSDLFRPFDQLAGGLQRTAAAVREWAGLAAYWALGRLSVSSFKTTLLSNGQRSRTGQRGQAGWRALHT